MPRVACFLAAAWAAPAEDKVLSLPGWEGALPSAWYSGFLNAGDSKLLHYVYIETESEEAKDTKPVTLWLNGGPGCSSLDGMLYEHGPLLAAAEDKLVRNPYAWTKASSMLYMEAPAGVGFSYRSDKKPYASNDTQTAADNLHALHDFFSKFPELKKREFYVSGESYAGVYVPTLSQAILHDKTVDWNMQGLLTGNGVMGWDLMSSSRYPFLAGHGGISTSQYKELELACKKGEEGAKCAELMQKADEATAGLNMYDFYRDCHANPDGLLGAIGRGRKTNLAAARLAPRPPHPSLGMSVPCIDSEAGTKWLGRDDVKKALHVEQSPNTWAICTTQVNYQRNMKYEAAPIYAELQRHYRIVVYHGDTDMACDYIQGQAAMEQVKAMANLTTKEDWVPWVLKDSEGDQVAGFLTTYGGARDYHFITVKGAGHMAPQWKPEASYAFFSRFLEKKDLRTGATKGEEIFVV
jgi:cathepsin A (carboxypeptidase C)